MTVSERELGGWHVCDSVWAHVCVRFGERGIGECMGMGRAPMLWAAL